MSEFLVQDGQTWLFQGDSITDAGRRAEAAPYGIGYASLFIEITRALFPDRQITFINRGIGGNTTGDLKERWDDDTIRFQPDWLSILVGINDIHRWLFNPDPAVQVSPDQYRENYDWLLSRVKNETSARLVLLEPFYISLSSRDTNRRRVLEHLPKYIDIARDMAEKYEAVLVPMHDVYQRQLLFTDAETFCPEPVHPNRSGHVVMAMELLRAVGGI